MSVPNTNVGLSSLQTEFGGSPPISISEYYAGGGNVPPGTSGPFGSVPSSGQINMGNFRGTQNIAYITATGGTEYPVTGGYKYHKFTGPGTFTVTQLGTPAQNNVDIVVAAGGGGGGGRGAYDGAGGGGAGGYRQINAIPVSVTGYPISIGGGGSGSSDRQKGGAGGSSSAMGYTSSGGGGGGCEGPVPRDGIPGGSEIGRAHV